MARFSFRNVRRRTVLHSLLGLAASGALANANTPSALAASADTQPGSAVQLQVSGMNAVISNGIYTVTFNSSGTGTSFIWHGRELIGPAKGFYSSINGGTGFAPTALQVVTNTADLVDIAYISPWGELHYVARRNLSGFYSYFVATGIGNVGEYRTLYRLDGSIFRNGYNAERSGSFPTLADIQAGTKLQDETWRLLDGTVYTKYNWASYVAQDRLHGIYGDGYGAWMISPSHEYINGGPMKQELMVHVESATGDGVLLNMLSASHFGTPNVTIPAGKVYGPWLVYFNDGDFQDARNRAFIEEFQWPYRWLSNPHYPLARSAVSGILRLADGRPAAGATVALALPGGDIYPQGTDYIYSAEANAAGFFFIPHVRPGNYSLYAYANGGCIGDITDQYEQDGITVSGPLTVLGILTWTPAKYAHLLWQLGQANRKTSGFKLGDLPRQYGLFDQTPANLTYTIGSSDPASDWYFAQTVAGTWTINFDLKQMYSNNAHLTIALAGMSRTVDIQIAVNGTVIGTLPNFANDAAIYRSANQSGYYHLVPLMFPASLLQAGTNSITFEALNISFGGGAMYDTIKLEVE